MAATKNISILVLCAAFLLPFSQTQADTATYAAALEARIKKTEDYQEIVNLQAQYSYLIDTLQMEALVELFADDFVWEGGFDRDSMKGVRSKPELLKLLQNAAQATTMMRHLATTPYIEIEGDNATGTWYVFGMLTAATPEGDVAKWVQGRLDNEYIRVNGQWKISRKSTTYNFSTSYEDSWVKAKKSADSLFEDDKADK